MDVTNNINLAVNYNSDETLEDLVIKFQDVKDGFSYSVSDVMMKADEFQKIINDIRVLHPDIKEYNFSRTNNNIFKRYVGENIRIYVMGNTNDMFGTFSTKNNDESIKIWDIYNKHVQIDSDVALYMYSYSLRGNQLIEDVSELDPDELNYISKSYYPYIDTDIMFDQFFTGAENILLLSGLPGVGKSKILSLALKHAITNPSKLPYDKMKDNSTIDHQFVTVINVKGIDVLGVDEFWGCLEKIKPDFVLIDDLDYMLTSRDTEITSQDDFTKNSFLDQFLTFTDGVIKNNTKFFITTNQPSDDIDTALLRKGRLFDILEFRHLTREESLVIWKENNLDVDKFNQTFADDNILPAELGSEINKHLNKRIETPNESYLKEDGISKIKTAAVKKHISL